MHFKKLAEYKKSKRFFRVSLLKIKNNKFLRITLVDNLFLNLIFEFGTGTKTSSDLIFNKIN